LSLALNHEGHEDMKAARFMSFMLFMVIFIKQ